jgi:hypothetical protein
MTDTEKKKIVIWSHSATNGARYRGLLKREPCAVCGETKKIHAHHENYNLPLRVIWLCAKHHKEYHRRYPHKNFFKSVLN